MITKNFEYYINLKNSIFFFLKNKIDIKQIKKTTKKKKQNKKNKHLLGQNLYDIFYLKNKLATNYSQKENENIWCSQYNFDKITLLSHIIVM